MMRMAAIGLAVLPDDRFHENQSDRKPSLNFCEPAFLQHVSLVRPWSAYDLNHGSVRLGANSALAQSNPRYIQFEPSATKGALYTPDSGPAPTVAFLTIHRTANFMNMIATRELPKRGFMVLGMNPRSDNNEASVNFENIALDIKQGVEFLRRQPGISKVILIGFSGGGPSTTFYQATAEKGPSYCQGPGKLTQCTAALANLPKADGMLLLDAHPGNTVNAMRSLNPAVLDENDPSKIDPSLDPFDARNGYNPNGLSVYASQFMARYFTAQAARMNRLIDKALAMREEIKQAEARQPTTRPSSSIETGPA